VSATDGVVAGGGGRVGPPPGEETADQSPRTRLRTPAVVGVVLAAVSYLSVFYHVTDVVGGVAPLVAEVTLAAGVGVVAATRLRERTAVVVAVVGFAAALGVYVLSVPESQRALFTVGRLAQDLLALSSGLSVLRLINAGTWALSLAPVPTFVVAYLAGRGRHVWAATVAAATTGFFVLTSDAGVAAALAGAVGVTAAVGLAGLAGAGRRGLVAQWDTVVVIVTAMVLITSLVTVVPGGGNTVVPGGSPSVESSLVSNDDRVSVLGSISLSPSVRFTVEADRPAYWRVGTYDRYTGGGWVRTGDASPYDSRQAGPPGETTELEQSYTVRTKFDAIPAANRPVRIAGETQSVTQVTSNGGFTPATTLAENETYTVVSQRPSATTAELRRAGVGYPDGVTRRYTGLPGSTPDRVSERTQTVIEEAGAETPYDAAIAIERYLESTKEYSLDVENPSGNIADSFLFEMDAGYCTYYATTMVTMLWSQGIPARFATGYTTGQRVAEDEYVVRGLDSHAWVEVYFPEVGWVRFDPTPAADRSDTEQSTLEAAREGDAANVDTAGSSEGVYTTPPPTFESTAAGDDDNGPGPGGCDRVAGACGHGNDRGGWGARHRRRPRDR
jgi:Transglutaminase-like enzymes, putative cysteine proteases